MSDDNVEDRAKLVMGQMRKLGMPNVYTLETFKDLTVEMVSLVPELVAEVERLRSVVDGEPT